jgi:flagellar motor protein MotB
MVLGTAMLVGGVWFQKTALALPPEVGDLIQAHGLGRGSPVADNATADGRAHNRRIEIVVAREPHAPNP